MREGELHHARHSRALARNLKDGHGRDETIRLFERMQIIIRDLQVRAPSSPPVAAQQRK